MKNKCIAIGGIPGTGKSTIIKNLLEMHKNIGVVDIEPLTPAKTLDGLKLGVNHFIVGKYAPYYETDETFPGTDRLSMSVQPVFLKFARETDMNIVFEGDRLFTGSCLEELEEIFGENLKIVILTAEDEVLQERYKKRGSDQPAKFINSRKTKVTNITSNFSLMDNIEYIDTTNISQEEVFQQFMEIVSWN